MNAANYQLKNSSTKGSDSVFSGHAYEKKLSELLNIGLVKQTNLSSLQAALLQEFSEATQINGIYFIDSHHLTGMDKSDIWVNILYGESDKITDCNHVELGFSLKNTSEQTQFGLYEPEKFLSKFYKDYPYAIEGIYKFLGFGKYAQQFNSDYGHEKRNRYYLDELSMQERKELTNLLTNKNFLEHVLEMSIIGKDTNKADYILAPQDKNSQTNLLILPTSEITSIIRNKYINSENLSHALTTNINIWDSAKKVYCKQKDNGKYIPPPEQGGIYLFGDLIYLQRKGSSHNCSHLQIKSSVKKLHELYNLNKAKGLKRVK